MLHSCFKNTDKTGKTFRFIVLPLIDISYFCDTEIVDNHLGTVDPNFVVNLKTPHRSGVTHSNTNNSETPTIVSKFKPPQNDKTDRKMKEERRKRV